MNRLSPILIKSFVLPFYRENAGAFFFFITIMFLCVGPLNGAGVIEYHYSLMTAAFKSQVFTLLICAGWILFARKCSSFVIKKQSDPGYSFFHILTIVDARKRFGLCLQIQLLLFAPVLIYGSIFVITGAYQHYFITPVALTLCMVLCCVIPAIRQMDQLNYLRKRRVISWHPFNRASVLHSYPFILLRFIFGSQKWVFVAIKIFTCGVLYGMALNNSPDDYDINFPFLFFNFGVMANGYIVYKLRVFEETYLLFYRNMPVSLIKRFLQYVIIYAILLIPEWIIIITLTPFHLTPHDAWNVGLSAFGVLLFINSLYFLDDFSMKAYLRALLVVLCVEYFFVIADALSVLYPLLFITAALIFFTNYYSFEKAHGQIGS